jgi:glycosyl transferase family 25
MNSISDIKHAFYINLLSRPDRKQHVESQLNSIGIQAERFNAIKLPNGAIGCSMSHLKIIETAKENDWDHVLIVEDDILFTDPKLFMKQFNLFLSKNKTFDVVLIAGNNIPPYTKIDDSCVKVTHCQTTTGYLVQKHYYDTLITNYKEGILRLMKEPEKHSLYAIDKYWFNLQEIHNWFLITPLTVTQREDYSDIEKRPTNYTPAMLDLDKVAFLQRQRDIALLKNIKYFNFH